MKLLVIYDITDDRLRGRSAELLKDFGLARVQYSAYAGDLSKNRREMLEIAIADLLTKDGRCKPSDRLYVMPLCDACFASARFLGRESHFPDHRVDRYEIV